MDKDKLDDSQKKESTIFTPNNTTDNNSDEFTNAEVAQASDNLIWDDAQEIEYTIKNIAKYKSAKFTIDELAEVLAPLKSEKVNGTDPNLDLTAFSEPIDPTKRKPIPTNTMPEAADYSNKRPKLKRS